MIRIRDEGRLRAWLLGLPDAVRGKTMQESLLLGAAPMAEAVRAAAPMGRTGHLKQSIEVANGPVKDTTATVYVRARHRVAPHAHLVEYGHAMVSRAGRVTGRVPAHPFMRPAFEATADHSAQLAIDDLRRRVIDAARARAP